MIEINKIHNLDCIEGLKLLENESIDCCITSPPYYGLRDYQVKGQIGLEDTPDLYVEKLVEIFHEIKRVLKKSGNVWLNLGDSYCGGGFGTSKEKDYDLGKQGTNRGTADYDTRKKLGSLKAHIEGLKTKDLIGIPWMVAFALRADGWYLRQDIIWSKNNPMPESVTDRCTKSHEHIFLLSKSANYYFDSEAIAEPIAESTTDRLAQNNGNMKACRPRYGGKKYTEDTEIFNRTKSGNAYDYRPMRNKRDVWVVSTKPFKESHFATFPEELITPCVLAGCPQNGIILDPFMGAGTTALVALKNKRQYIGFELNSKYCKLAEKRIEQSRVIWGQIDMSAEVVE